MLALAPKLLSNLPKSGTWMNVMKVTFGILELALALQKNMNDEYVISSLYVDDKTELPEYEWVKLNDGTVLQTLGEKNLYYENEAFCAVSQPLYVVMDPSTGKTLRKQSYSDDKKAFFEFLKD